MSQRTELVPANTSSNNRLSITTRKDKLQLSLKEFDRLAQNITLEDRLYISSWWFDEQRFIQDAPANLSKESFTVEIVNPFIKINSTGALIFSDAINHVRSELDVIWGRVRGEFRLMWNVHMTQKQREGLILRALLETEKVGDNLQIRKRGIDFNFNSLLDPLGCRFIDFIEALIREPRSGAYATPRMQQIFQQWEKEQVQCEGVAEGILEHLKRKCVLERAFLCVSFAVTLLRLWEQMVTCGADSAELRAVNDGPVQRFGGSPAENENTVKKPKKSKKKGKGKGSSEKYKAARRAKRESRIEALELAASSDSIPSSHTSDPILSSPPSDSTPSSPPSDSTPSSPPSYSTLSSPPSPASEYSAPHSPGTELDPHEFEVVDKPLKRDVDVVSVNNETKSVTEAGNCVSDASDREAKAEMTLDTNTSDPVESNQVQSESSSEDPIVLYPSASIPPNSPALMDSPDPSTIAVPEEPETKAGDCVDCDYAALEEERSQDLKATADIIEVKNEATAEIIEAENDLEAEMNTSDHVESNNKTSPESDRADSTPPDQLTTIPPSGPTHADSSGLAVVESEELEMKAGNSVGCDGIAGEEEEERSQDLEAVAEVIEVKFDHVESNQTQSESGLGDGGPDHASGSEPSAVVMSDELDTKAGDYADCDGIAREEVCSQDFEAIAETTEMKNEAIAEVIEAKDELTLEVTEVKNDVMAEFQEVKNEAMAEMIIEVKNGMKTEMDMLDCVEDNQAQSGSGSEELITQDSTLPGSPDYVNISEPPAVVVSEELEKEHSQDHEAITEITKAKNEVIAKAMEMKGDSKVEMDASDPIESNQTQSGSGSVDSNPNHADSSKLCAVTVPEELELKLADCAGCDGIVGQEEEECSQDLEVTVEITQVKNETMMEDVEAKDEEVTEVIEAKDEEVTEVIEAKDEEVTEVIEAKDEEVTEVVEAKDEGVAEVVETKDEEVTEDVEVKDEAMIEVIEVKNDSKVEMDKFDGTEGGRARPGSDAEDSSPNHVGSSNHASSSEPSAAMPEELETMAGDRAGRDGTASEEKERSQDLEAMAEVIKVKNEATAEITEVKSEAMSEAMEMKEDPKPEKPSAENTVASGKKAKGLSRLKKAFSRVSKQLYIKK